MKLSRFMDILNDIKSEYIQIEEPDITISRHDGYGMCVRITGRVSESDANAFLENLLIPWGDTCRIIKIESTCINE